MLRVSRVGSQSGYCITKFCITQILNMEMMIKQGMSYAVVQYCTLMASPSVLPNGSTIRLRLGALTSGQPNSAISSPSHEKHLAETQGKSIHHHFVEWLRGIE